MKKESLYKLIEKNFDDYEIEDTTIRIMVLSSYDIIVEFYEDKCDIYADVAAEYYHPIVEYDNSIHRIAYILWVVSRANIEPKYITDYNSYNKFGYFSVLQDEIKIIEYINWLYVGEEINLNVDKMDLDYIMKNYPDVYSIYIEAKEIYQSELISNLSHDEWVHISKHINISEKFDFNKNDIVYINHANTMLCGIGEGTLKK